jgi:ATP-dependent 26S proteasome regulatory subunit
MANVVNVLSKSTREIGHLIRAAYSCLYIVTDEVERLFEELQILCDSYLNKEVKVKTDQFKIYKWSILDHWVLEGEKLPPSGSDDMPPNPLTDFLQIKTFKPFGICVMENFHFFLNDQSPELIQAVRDVSRVCSMENKTIVFANSVQQFPTEVGSIIHIVEHDLPGVDDINKAIDASSASVKQKSVDVQLTAEKRYAVIESLKGMELGAIENALAKSLVVTPDKTFDPKILRDVKCAEVKKTGQLEYKQSDVTFESIGGCENAKRIIRKAKVTLGAKAQKYNLDPMKAFLFLGVPGCCKSEFVKACGNELGIPVLKMDLSSMFGSLVGQSEQNIRNALKIADSMAPCIVHIDEFDKGMSGVGGSGSHDGGTTVRVGGVLLTWMNDHTSQVIVMCTANNVKEIPTEYLRKGRFSEILFFDIPTAKERVEIFRVQLKRQKLDASKYDLKALADCSGQFTGAEIMAAVGDAKMDAADNDRFPTTEDIIESVKRIIPEAKKNKIRIEEVRQRASEIAQPASIPEKETPSEPVIAGHKFRSIQA